MGRSYHLFGLDCWHVSLTGWMKSVRRQRWQGTQGGAAAAARGRCKNMACVARHSPRAVSSLQRSRGTGTWQARGVRFLTSFILHSVQILQVDPSPENYFQLIIMKQVHIFLSRKTVVPPNSFFTNWSSNSPSPSCVLKSLAFIWNTWKQKKQNHAKLRREIGYLRGKYELWLGNTLLLSCYLKDIY